MAPVEVPAEQPVSSQNIVEGDKIDIRKFPAQDVAARRRHVSRHRRRRHHHGPGDRARQRRHLPDDDQGPARDRRLHLARQGRRRDRDKWWKMGKPAPIAAAYGIDPLLFLVGATSLPKTECEYEYYSGSRARRSSCSPPTSPACRFRRMPRSSSRAISIRTRPSPKARSASSPAITAGPAARRPTCASSGCAIATIRRSPAR